MAVGVTPALPRSMVAFRLGPLGTVAGLAELSRALTPLEPSAVRCSP